MAGVPFRKSLFVRGVSWDAVPSVEAQVEHFTCKMTARQTQAIVLAHGILDILKAARFEGFNPLVKMLDDVVQDELKDIPKDKIKIMDAGAGTGLVGAELHKFGFMTIDALDISPGMLNEAKKKNVYKKFICAALGDQQISEVKTGEYDILVCVGALLIAHVPPVALVEIMRMVRPGGLVCFGIRDAEMETYHGKMVELEKAGHCKLVKKKKVPHYERDDLTKESNALVYKVLKH